MLSISFGRKINSSNLKVKPVMVLCLLAMVSKRLQLRALLLQRNAKGMKVGWMAALPAGCRRSAFIVE